MKLLASSLSLALLSVLAAPAAHAEIAIDSIGGSEIGFEGLLQTDGYWYDSDFINLDADAGDGSDTDFGLRRAELVLKGKGSGNVEWVVGYDASGDGKFLDANIKYKIGGSKTSYIQVGQFKQPNSMEELSSTKNNDFMAKAAITNTFGVGRRLGGSYTYGGDNWAVTGSAFGRELTRNRAHGSGYGAHAYWAPINDKGSILHLGLSYVDYDTDADSLRYRARPDADFANRIIDTGTFVDADRVSTIDLESFWVSGPFKLQGEYMSSKVDRYGVGFQDFTGSGGYVSGVWNVTGETWSYKSGTPGTPLPDNPASGMWQLGLRYDTLDLNDSGVLGGKMNTITAGVNYYWRSNFKLMLDYTKVSSDRRGISFEGKYRARNAEVGWLELQKYADTIITVPNDRLLSIMQKNSKLSDMLSMADNVLLQAVKGITDLINVPGLINADFADLRTVMKEVGPAVMGSGFATGENRATEAARKAIDNQLLEDFGIDGARGLLINISASEETFTMAEFMEASALIQEKVDDDAKVVIGALYDDALGDELHVTVIATGVGGMIDKKETINPVEDHMRRPATIKEPEKPTKGAPASPNRQPRVTRLPGSNFDALDNLGSSKAPEGKSAKALNWNDDYLETPTYLRKKAN